MRRTEAHGLVTYHFDSLACDGLVHAVFTRQGGVSQVPFATLNVGRSVGDDLAAVAENLRRIYAHLGLTADQIATAYQVHGNRVAVVTAADAGRVIPNTDGLVTATPGVALFLRFADCQPVLLYDPAHQALGLVHAGWRGVSQGIVRRAVEAMQAAFGTRPGGLIAGLGPAIGPCCYTVGHDVAAAMGYALPDWRQVMAPQDDDSWRFDLPAANAQQLAAAGVEQIEQAGLCTASHQDEFYSHRGDNGRTGRFAVVAYLARRNEGRAEQSPAQERTGGPAAEPPPDDELSPDSLLPPGFPELGEWTGGER